LFAAGHAPQGEQSEAPTITASSVEPLAGGMMGGGMMGGYFGGGVARAMETGAGMSLGANLLNSIFR
jgi:hypothetical protein